jgi:hypothetical protein
MLSDNIMFSNNGLPVNMLFYIKYYQITCYIFSFFLESSQTSEYTLYSGIMKGERIRTISMILSRPSGYINKQIITVCRVANRDYFAKSNKGKNTIMLRGLF